MMLLILMVLGQLLVGIACANSNNNNNGNMAPQAVGHGHSGHPIPRFSSVEELCEWLCQRQSPNFDYGCPPSCDGGIVGAWSKRAARGRRFDDFSFGFDDYLFMKLLGRDLGERA